MQDETKILDFRNRTRNKPGTPARPSIPLRYNNGNGGESNMDDKDFVTHTELELSSEKLLQHIDEHFKQVDDHFNHLEKKMDANKADTDLKFEQVNTKFEKQKVWFYGTAIGIVTATCTIVGFLIHYL